MPGVSGVIRGCDRRRRGHQARRGSRAYIVIMETQAPLFARLSDAELVTEVSRLAERERVATSDLIAALVVFDARRLYLGEGFPSLFAYCTLRLRLSEHAAYHRIEAARAARKFPRILGHLSAGSLTLTTVGLLASHLTEANCDEVLAAATGRSKREVEALVAALAPRPDAPASIRRVPERKMVGAATRVGVREEPRAAVLPSADGAEPVAAVQVEQPPTAPAARPAVIRPLTPARYYLQLTVSADTERKLRRLQDLMRRENPSGDPAAIVDQALTLLLAQVERKRFAALSGRPKGPGEGRASREAAKCDGVPSSTRADRLAAAASIERKEQAPRSRSSPSRRSRTIPAAVKREVWRRDQGRCGYVGRDGQRCSATTLLEYHHRVAFADRGASTVENLMLACTRHHRRESERVFAWTREPDAALGAGEPYGGTIDSVRTELPG